LYELGYGRFGRGVVEILGSFLVGDTAGDDSASDKRAFSGMNLQRLIFLTRGFRP